MTLIKQITTTITLALLLASTPALAQSLVEQWQQGLSGSKLASYSGSSILSSSKHSSLTLLNFCSNGRYSYYQEGGWMIPSRPGGTSQASGASNNTITGRWDIQQQGTQTMLVYITDYGESGAFPIYLQTNGRVNIGGTEFAVEQGGAGC